PVYPTYFDAGYDPQALMDQPPMINFQDGYEPVERRPRGDDFSRVRKRRSTLNALAAEWTPTGFKLPVPSAEEGGNTNGIVNEKNTEQMEINNTVQDSVRKAQEPQ